MALTLAPSYNQPTVTSGACASGAAASTIISGSPGWLREKRIGAAETAAGASQTATTGLDLTGSTRYRYNGVPAAIAYASNTAQYVSTELQPGALANSHWPFCVEMVTDSPTVAFRYNAPSTNPSLGRILVDGLPITDVVGAATSAAGSGYYVKLAFPDSRTRTITVIGGNANQGRWGGCAVESTYTITKPTDTLGLMAVIADSYGRGAGTVGGLDTAAWRAAWELGYGRMVCLAMVGGTGINYDSTGDATASFDGRVSTVMGFSPEVVLVLGGRNDTGNAALQTALEALLDSIGSTPLRVVASTASESGQATVRSYMAAAAASRSVAYIDTVIDSLPKLDSVHPTQAGHITLTDELGAEWPSAAVTGTLAANTPTTTVAVPTAAWAGTAVVPVFTGTTTADIPTATLAVPLSSWSGVATVPTFTGSVTANTPAVTAAVPTATWSGTATVPTFAGALTADTPAAVEGVPSVAWSGTSTVPVFTGTLTASSPPAIVVVPLASWAGTVTAPSGGGGLTTDTPAVTVAVPSSNWAGTATVPVYSGLVGADTPAALVTVPLSIWAGTVTTPGALVATIPGVTVAVLVSAWIGMVTDPGGWRDITITATEPRRAYIIATDPGPRVTAADSGRTTITATERQP